MSKHDIPTLDLRPKSPTPVVNIITNYGRFAAVIQQVDFESGGVYAFADMVAIVKLAGYTVEPPTIEGKAEINVEVLLLPANNQTNVQSR